MPIQLGYVADDEILQQQPRQEVVKSLSESTFLSEKGPTMSKELMKQVKLQRHNSTPTSCSERILTNQNRSSSFKVSKLYAQNSPINRFQRHRHSRSHNAQQVSTRKSATSSSASDSAFSQSQSTLESDSSERSSFEGSFLQSSDKLKLKEALIVHSNENKTSIALDRSESTGINKHPIYLDKVTPDRDDSNYLEKNDDHFKIIWRTLSYRVPDKKFARISTYLKKKKDAFWPSKSEDEIRQLDDSTSSVSSSTDEPPMKAPTTGKPRKIIFKDLNGCVKSGQLTAILGPSGAGKTTFLKCLTNSIVKGVSGSIDIKGGPASSQQLKLCIIPQKDYLFDNLTVMENLVFASRIKNTEAKFDHTLNVERVADLLGLQSCINLKTSKLSGGQYKRVSIAQELLSKPDILILDEPTSGLDSLTCFRTVSVLRDLVNRSQSGLMPPLAIIMTIHQPQIKIFNLFHHVYILSSLGQCVYEGRPENLVSTVADCCKLLPPPDDLNPASFIIDIASEVYGLKPIDQLTMLQRKNSDTTVNNNYSLLDDDKIKTKTARPNNSALNNSLIKLESFGNKDWVVKPQMTREADEEGMQFHNDSETFGQLEISDKLKRRNNHSGKFWLHTGLLIKRLWISMWRDPLLTTTRITFHLIIPFVFYFIYSQKSGMANACPHVEREIDFQSMTSDANIHRLKVQHNELILSFENVSLFFLLLYSFSMCVLAVTALSFPLNMQILLKETSNGWYSMPRFVMAKTLADLPIELTMPMVSVAIAYVLTGQPSSYLCWRMLTVTAVMTLCSLISQTQGLLFGAYFMNNVQAAVFVSQASSLPWIMLSGFTTRISELPTILQWLSFGSIYRLGIESIVAVRYGFGMCPCNSEVVNETPAKLVGIPDQLRSVMRYYLDMYSDPPTNSTVDVFEKIAATLSRANTYGVDIGSCHDVRPFILSAREVDEGTLPTFLLILVLIFFGLKVLLFGVVRLRAV